MVRGTRQAWYSFWSTATQRTDSRLRQIARSRVAVPNCGEDWNPHGGQNHKFGLESFLLKEWKPVNVDEKMPRTGHYFCTSTNRW
ncbi:hypothetical protein B9Z55_015707 [Caenorhabditis nigoni]|uniref:Uncharacterized protein n=1 Tax=Caenorhabditis nigoni TaxID=1611254 RepID=A0A2G5UBE5_9PELO|nr:hypothetical protein B9Z55_015707 [Caenorhabditis nigoni]